VRLLTLGRAPPPSPPPPPPSILSKVLFFRVLFFLARWASFEHYGDQVPHLNCFVWAPPPPSPAMFFFFLGHLGARFVSFFRTFSANPKHFPPHRYNAFACYAAPVSHSTPFCPWLTRMVPWDGPIVLIST